MTLISHKPLVPGRECGSCSVCCVALTIDDATLQKPQGIRCPNLNASDRCSIYEARPTNCATFYCGYRRLDWVSDTMRPDASGVLVVLGYINPARWELGVSFIVLQEAALEAEGLAESVAAAIEAELTVDIVVPGPPGHTSGWGRVNDVLREEVARKDMAAVRRIVRQVYATRVSGDHQPIEPGHTT